MERLIERKGGKGRAQHQHEARHQDRAVDETDRGVTPGPRYGEAHERQPRQKQARRTWPGPSSAPGPGENRRTSSIRRPTSAIEPATNARRSIRDPPDARPGEGAERHERGPALRPGATQPPPRREVQDGEACGQVGVLGLEHRERQKGQAAAHPAGDAPARERRVEAPEHDRHEREREPRRMAAEQGLEPRMEQREPDRGDQRRRSVARELSREPERGQPACREGQQDQQVVGGVETESRQDRERQGQGQEGLGEVPAGPVDPELVRIREERGGAEQSVPHEPHLVEELERVARHPG